MEAPTSQFAVGDCLMLRHLGVTCVVIRLGEDGDIATVLQLGEDGVIHPFCCPSGLFEKDKLEISSEAYQDKQALLTEAETPEGCRAVLSGLGVAGVIFRYSAEWQHKIGFDKPDLGFVDFLYSDGLGYARIYRYLPVELFVAGE